MSNVVELPVVTTLDLPVERVLDKAKDAELKVAIVVGETAEGGLYFASNVSDGGDVLWWLKKAEKALLEI